MNGGGAVMIPEAYVDARRRTVREAAARRAAEAEAAVADTLEGSEAIQAV